MRKKKLVSAVKNSNSETEPVIKITEDTCCIVHFKLPGAFKDHGQNANTKEEVRRMKASPILDENKKGRFICSRYNGPGRKLGPNESLPSSYYEGPKTYNPPTYHECYSRRVYSPEAIAFLSSVDAKPYNIQKKAWEALPIVNRLRIQFAIDASELNVNDPYFTCEFVN